VVGLVVVPDCLGVPPLVEAGAGYTFSRAFYIPAMWFMFMFITPVISGMPYLQRFMKFFLQKSTPSR